MLSRNLDLQTWNRLTHQGQEKEKRQREKKEKTDRVRNSGSWKAIKVV